MSTPVAIVTGAARGIGAGIASRLAKDGFVVAVVDLDAERGADTVDQIRAQGGTAVAFGADVTDEQAVSQTVADIAGELGGPTALVNNAGITRDNLVFKMTLEDWESVNAVHLRGAFLMTRATQKHMVEARYGRIVNISSTSALGNRGQSNYSAAKAGLQGLTKTLAIELGPFGVTVNSVAPGFIATDMTQDTARRLGISFEEHVTRSAVNIPVRRVGEPEDIANAVAFFLSPNSGFVSGQVLYVAGGPRS